MEPVVTTALAAIYALVWIMTARHLFHTHKAPNYEWYRRGHRVKVATGYAFLALLWPLCLVYLAITAHYRRGPNV